MFRSEHFTLVFGILYFIIQVHYSYSEMGDGECLKEGILYNEKLISLSKQIIPDLNGKRKGEAGKIGVIGGSIEYTGAPYFAALSALRVGADLLYVITTEQAAPVIKSYSPDLIVHPIFNKKYYSKLNQLISKLDVVVIGPGAGKDDEQIKLIIDIIETCKNLRKALVVDADGLFAISKNVSVLSNYPKPGAILTPNHREASLLSMAVSTNNDSEWTEYWGDNVSILVKGQEDTCYTSTPKFRWVLVGGGSPRRAAGQGDILAGALGTFFNWAIDANLCNNAQTAQLAQSVAIFAAAQLTRACNKKAFEENGRNMIASDMLKKIPSAFNEIFL